MKGALNGFGNAYLRLARQDGSVLRLELMFSMDDSAGALSIAVVGGAFCAMGSVEISAPPPLSPRYTVAFIPRATDGVSPSLGSASATLLLGRSGAYRGAGTLEDGKKIAFSGRVMRNHFEGVIALPLYVRLAMADCAPDCWIFKM